MDLGKSYLVNGAPAKFVAEHCECKDSIFVEYSSGKTKRVSRSEIGDELVAQYVGCGLIDGVITLTTAKNNEKHAKNSWSKHFNGQFLYVMKIDVGGVEKIDEH
tara:strand:+ start:3396 stop:3707 length:312 start_codon:yes stop_codon:yes gene_type:complete